MPYIKHDERRSNVIAPLPGGTGAVSDPAYNGKSRQAVCQTEQMISFYLEAVMMVRVTVYVE